MGDDIGGVKKMGTGNRRHAVAQVLLASTLMMLVATSHCMMTTSTITAGNSTAASSAWCDGHIVNGQCILIPYRGREHLEYLDRMLMEYDDSGETSSRRVLGDGKTNIYDVVRNTGEYCHQGAQRYTCLGPPNIRLSGCLNVYNRDCQK